jgi:hypothetical protein
MTTLLSLNPESLWARQNLTLGLMLAALHLSLVLDLDGGASGAFLLAHFGLFLLWQPVWQGGRDLVPSQAALVVAVGGALAWWTSWWLLALWTAVLFSLIGGNVPAMRTGRQRLASLLAALYLLAMLLMWVVPNLFGATAEYSQFALGTIRFGLALLVAAIPLLATEPRRERPRYTIDLVYSVLLFLLVVVLVLGAFFVQQVTRGDYVMALAKTVLGIAGVMLLLSWLWDPRGGFEGIGQLLSRYFLSLGMPFERWMYSLASISEREPDPERFLAGAIEEMLGLPWLSGASWNTARGSGSSGSTTRVGTRFNFGDMTVELYTRWRPSPALLLHMRLLAQLLGDYYDAKVREEAQRRTAYLQAIYETGSRLTHDVKNLLQSLRSLCSAAETTGSADAEALQRLIQRQLPQIAQRLQVTLDKLDARRTPGEPEMSPAGEWWRALGQRYAHEGVEFRARPLPAEVRLPADLFDSVADNLLQNGLEKRRRREASRVTATLDCDDGRCTLKVSDDGALVPDELARQFFSSPVLSEDGLGVGLYQSARHANERGYGLRLESNRDGEVSFVLSPAQPQRGLQAA